MLGTGKYNFPGIRKAGAQAIELALATTTWGAAIMATPLKYLVSLGAAWISEWAANRGLVLINIGAIYSSGAVDQKVFDAAMDEALDKVKPPGLSDDEKKAIDEKVRNAFRKFARISSEPK